jgi:hypothetical protein
MLSLLTGSLAICQLAAAQSPPVYRTRNSSTTIVRCQHSFEVATFSGVLGGYWSKLRSVPTPLEYAPLPRNPRRFFTLRRITWFLAILAIILAALFYKETGHQIALLLAQHKMMIRTAPPEQVVLTFDPDEAKKLVASSSNYIYDRLRETPVIRLEPDWNSFILQMGSDASFVIPRKPEALIFSHEMRTPSGERFLVGMHLMYKGLPDPTPLVFGATVIRPGSLFSEPAAVSSQMCEISFYSYSFIGRSTRIFAGQFDPSDPSHATILYKLDGEFGILDVHLRDDKNLVVTVRNGPARHFTPTR